ncbi:MAG: FHA domain-containing protein [Alphaproteobacteria bacterium]|nr:FHA domain-containing protein [Alphaproteobacteria bacterium]
MARIRKRQSDPVAVVLLPNQVVGRGHDCRLRDRDPHVSGHHAELRWSGRRWELEDLSSHNGTWVDGVRVRPRQPVALVDEMVLAFGRPENEWEVVDTAPPVPVAECGDGSLIVARGDILALPGDEEPMVTVHRTGDGVWWLESADEAGPVTTGTMVTIDGVPWTLHLPVVQASTLTLQAAAATPGSVQLRLQVQQEGRHVDAFVVLDGDELAVGPRSNHQLLLALARARVEDRLQRDPREGWRDQAALSAATGLEGNALNVAVHRLRRCFEAVGLRDAAAAVERRSAPRELRLGIEEIFIDER